MLDAAHATPGTKPAPGGVNPRAAESSNGTHSAHGGTHLDPAHAHAETQECNGRVNPLPTARAFATSVTSPPSEHLDGGHAAHETQSINASVNTLPAAMTGAAPRCASPLADLPPGRADDDTRDPFAGGDLPADHGTCDNHGEAVGGDHHDALLLILADALDDLERARIATENRLRSLGQVKGLDGSREAATMQHIAEALAELEHKATLDLKRAMRAHPLGPWVARTVGIGEKQGARLLATIGDPATRKMPSQLWQYCGHGAPSKRQRGVKSWWNPTAKMRLHLIAEAIVKAGVRKSDDCDDSDGYDFKRRRATTPLAAVYIAARADWSERDTSEGHKHNHALRMVGKAVLLDLWREAREAQA